LKILLLTSEFPPYTWGGLGRYSYEVYQELKRRDIRVTVLNIPSYYFIARNEKPKDSIDIKMDGHNKIIHVVNNELLNFYTTKGTLNMPSYGLNLYRKVLEILMKTIERDYDVIFVQDYYNSLIAALLYLEGFSECIISVHHLPLYAGFTYFDKPVSDEIHQFLEAILIRYSQKLIVPSQFTKRVLIQIYNVDPKDIIVIPLGVRVSLKNRENNIVEKSDKGSKIKLLSVLRFTEQKGLTYIVALMDELRRRGLNFKYSIIGDGPRLKDFFKLINEYSLTSYIHHEKFVKNIFTYYSHHDIYISTSLYETFGLTILEAMAYGCVPIAFNVGAVNEIIQNGTTGFLVDTGDIESMADLVEMLSRKRNKLTSIKKNAMSRAKEFSWEKHTDELLRIFKECR